jgi:hypothetical protein
VSAYQVIVETDHQPREFVLSEFIGPEDIARDAADQEVLRVLSDPPEGVTNAYAHRRHY